MFVLTHKKVNALNLNNIVPAFKRYKIISNETLANYVGQRETNIIAQVDLSRKLVPILNECVNECSKKGHPLFGEIISLGDESNYVRETANRYGNIIYKMGAHVDSPLLRLEVSVYNVGKEIAMATGADKFTFSKDQISEAKVKIQEILIKKGQQLAEKQG
ncbi:MAG: hypothetical protein NT051_06940 [Candidatus Micrarchaeota archaeon]|nr:hypothetical protein [Candidatus Micrarchaeota archaeon]